MTVKTKIERGDRYSAPEVYSLEITLLECLRGDEAGRLLAGLEAGDEYSRATGEGQTDPGYELVLARVQLGYFSKGRGFSRAQEPYCIGPDSFASSSADGRTEYPRLPQQPEPSLIGASFFPRDVKEGWIALQVSENERRPLLLFKREYSANAYGKWGDIYFQLW